MSRLVESTCLLFAALAACTLTAGCSEAPAAATPRPISAEQLATPPAHPPTRSNDHDAATAQMCGFVSAWRLAQHR